MKKQYIKPKATVMKIHSGTHLLNGSIDYDNMIVIGNKTTINGDDMEIGDGGDDAASRRRNNLWDDFEDDEW